jgi:hypothetical protein
MSLFRKKRKTLKAIEQELMPDRQFAEKAKQQFLASFDFHQSTRSAGAVFLSGTRENADSTRTMRVWRYVGGFAAALALITATSAFADVANVAPTNPLYPLKRLAEQTQLDFASNSEKPILELSFAERRAAEVDALAAASNATSNTPLIANLTASLDDDVSSSLAGATQAPLPSGARASFCGAMDATSSEEASVTGTFAMVSVREELYSHADLGARAHAVCGIMITAQAAGGATTTITTSTTTGNHEKGGGNAIPTSGSVNVVVPPVHVAVPTIFAPPAEPSSGSAAPSGSLPGGVPGITIPPVPAMPSAGATTSVYTSATAPDATATGASVSVSVSAATGGVSIPVTVPPLPLPL